MSIFPAQYSTLSSLALNSHLQQRYQLTDTTCRLLIRNVSDTYVLENATSKYIFKIYRNTHRQVEEIKGEAELLMLLVEGGAKVSYPVADINGEMLQCFQAAEGTRYGILFTWAEGEVVNNMNNKQLNIVGRELAVIHQISSTVQLNHYRKPYTIETTLTLPLANLKSAFKGVETEYAYLTATAQCVAERMTTYEGALFSYGYCHYDLFPKNFHLDTDDRITFFDFDFVGKGLLANDITSFFIHYFLDVTYGKITANEAREAFQKFIQSYREVRRLTDEEINAIPDLGFAFWIFYLNFQYENFDDWSNIFFGVKFIKDRVSLVRKWMETASLLLPKNYV